MSEDEFSVYEFLPDGASICVARLVGAEEAVHAAKASTHKPAVLLGVICKVMITDGGDACVFLWEHDKGVTFPPMEKSQ